MGIRHEARMWAVQFLFQRDFNPGELEAALACFWGDKKANAKAREFTEKLVRGVEAHVKDLDVLLKNCSEHWDLKRMGAVDRNVMRVALYEMTYCADIPPVVSINEAVELAKELSGLESGKFVNGILDRARKELGRPGHQPAADGNG